MKNSLKTALLSLPLFLLACCAGEREEQPVQGGEIPLRIVPAISGVSSAHIGERAATRALVDGAFPTGSIIGLGISAPGAMPALSSVYDDFYGTFGGDAWRYSVTGGNRLSGFSNWGTIKVYGYYPYNEAVTDLGVIPFEIALSDGTNATATDATAQTDYMVAGTQTKDMTIPDPAGDLLLNFGHLMTAIDLCVNRVLPHETGSIQIPVLKLGRATFEISDGRAFTVSGTYDATDPDTAVPANNITPGATAEKMVIDYLSSTNIVYIAVNPVNPVPPRRLLVIMPELRQKAGAGFEDATVTITLEFTDQDGEFIEFDDGNPVVSFKLSEVVNAGDDNGLLAGYSYAITGDLGTYTHFTAPTGGTPTPPHVNRPELVDHENPQLIDM